MRHERQRQVPKKDIEQDRTKKKELVSAIQRVECFTCTSYRSRSLYSFLSANSCSPSFLNAVLSPPVLPFLFTSFFWHPFDEMEEAKEGYDHLKEKWTSSLNFWIRWSTFIFKTSRLRILWPGLWSISLFGYLLSFTLYPFVRCLVSLLKE